MSVTSPPCPRRPLVTYRVPQMIELWSKQGIVLPRHIWDRFHVHFACVTGTVRKCRPWFWGVLENIRLAPMFELAQAARIKPITADLTPHVLFPFHCQPLCDAVFEIYERECCCHHHFHITDLLGRLRDILERLPIPLPDPFPNRSPAPIRRLSSARRSHSTTRWPRTSSSIFPAM